MKGKVMKPHERQISIYLFLLMQQNDTFIIPFNQRLTKGDEAVAVIIPDVSGSPSHQSIAQHHHYKPWKSFLNFSPRHHQAQIFIDCLLYSGHSARCGEGKVERASEGFWKGAHLYLRSKLSASEMSLKGKETNAVALIKKSGPDQWAPSDCSACNFGQCRKWCHHSYSTAR